MLFLLKVLVGIWVAIVLHNSREMKNYLYRKKGAYNVSDISPKSA
jgi:hypothetical protein